MEAKACGALADCLCEEGELASTIDYKRTGFLFDEYKAAALLASMQRESMREDHSW